MSELIDHEPLIHPVRSASELVEMSMGEEFAEIDMTKWQPLWVKKILASIRMNVFGGLVVPELRLTALCTNTLLKAAAAYHELNGHIKTLSRYAGSKTTCLNYHYCLFETIAKREDRIIEDLIACVRATKEEIIAQELVSNTKEINILRPFARHRSLGKKARERINYLESLGSKEPWFCECLYASTPEENAQARAFCSHRAAMYLRGFLQERLGLSAEHISDLSYGFYSLSSSEHRTSDDFRLEPASVIPNTLNSGSVLRQLVHNAESLERKKTNDRVSQLSEELKTIMTKVVRTERTYDFIRRRVPVSEVFSINAHSSLFREICKTMRDGLVEYKQKSDAEFFSEPLSNMIASSFIMVTDGKLSLYVPKRLIPPDENVQALSLDVLSKLKALAMQTYHVVSYATVTNHLNCSSRSGSSCLFKEHLSLPETTISKGGLSYVSDHLLNEQAIESMVKACEESLHRLSKLRER